MVVIFGISGNQAYFVLLHESVMQTEKILDDYMGQKVLLVVTMFNLRVF